MRHFVCVVGARPNFVKMAPLTRALERRTGVRVSLVHTGQHYDETLSGSFFSGLKMRSPDTNLEVGSGSHGEQTARVLERFEKYLMGLDPHKFSFPYLGLNQRLIGPTNEGQVVRPLLI